MALSISDCNRLMRRAVLFAKKFGFQSTDGSNYVVSVEDLISYFQD